MKKKKDFKSWDVLPVTRFKPGAFPNKKSAKAKAKRALLSKFTLQAMSGKKRGITPKLKRVFKGKKASPSLFANISLSDEDNQSDNEENQVEEEKQIDEQNTANESDQESSSSLWEDIEADIDANIPEFGQGSFQGGPLKKKELGQYNFNKKIYVFGLGPKNLAIAVLKHPTTMLLSGAFSVRVLIGSVEVNGFQLTPDTPDFINVFCSPDLGILPFLTCAPCHQDGFALLAPALASLDAHSLIGPVKEVFSSTSVLLAFKRPSSISGPNYAANIMKTPFFGTFSVNSFPYLERLNIKLQEVVVPSKIIRLLPSQKQVVSDVTSSIALLASKGTVPIILVCGPHNIGKLTLLHNLINSFLQKFPSVFHLELDPVHPEFTPPGCVSLTKVSSPLLGPSFTHLKQPVKSVFLGQMNISKIGPTYHAAMLSLLNHYNDNYLGRVPLFISTLSSTSGLGYQFLVDIIRYSRPSHVIQFIEDDCPEGGDFYTLPLLTPTFLAEARGWGSNVFKYSPTFTYLKVNSSQFYDDLSLSQKQALSICSYLGRLQTTTVLRPIVHLTPYCVPWNSLAVCFCNDVVSDSQLFQVLNASFVALCLVENEILESALPPDTGFPAIISGSPINECLGFGLICRIDLSNKAFHIITPEPLICLSLVNALFHGKLTLPEEIFTKQDGDNALPYLSRSIPSSQRLNAIIDVDRNGRQ